MPARSELVEIPGNADLTPAQRAERIATVYRPFCEAVSGLLDAEARAIVTVHSFTPVYFGAARPTEIGILHDSDARLAEAMLATRDDRVMSHTAAIFEELDRDPDNVLVHDRSLSSLPRGLKLRRALVGRFKRWM